MLRTFLVGCSLALLSTVNGVASAEPLSAVDQGAVSDADSPDAAPRAFLLLVDSAVTKDSVIPAILAAGHRELATACASSHAASIRVFNPLASGSYADVACSTILDGIGVSSAALRSEVDGPIGQVQQKWSPFGLVCSALILGATLAWNWPGSRTGCNAPGAENPTACQAVTSLGGGGLGLLCNFI